MVVAFGVIRMTFIVTEMVRVTVLGMEMMWMCYLMNTLRSDGKDEVWKKG